jgi:hypothetical protein
VKDEILLSRRRTLSTVTGLLTVGGTLKPVSGSPSASHPDLALGRPHADFIRLQTVPVHELRGAASKPFTEGKPLSYDAAGNRAVTQVVRFPTGWRHDRAHYIDSEEEFYVISGDLECNGTVYRQGDYANLPAGFPRSTQSSDAGAIVLYFYDGPHRAVYEAPPEGLYRPRRLVERLETSAPSWVPGNPEDVLAWGKAAQRKALRADVEGQASWLVHSPPDAGGVLRAAVVHESVEEIFVLQGELATPRGTMGPGAYAWRSPGVPCGPAGTRTGFTALVRAQGGPLRTRAVGNTGPISWNAPYDPMIPPDQRDWAFNDFDRTQMF